jgi:cell division protein FtsW
MEVRMRRVDGLLRFVTTVLVLLGLVILYSTSSARSSDPHFFLKRQFVWLVIGTASCYLVSLLDYRMWRRYCWLLLGITAALLVLVLIPGIGIRVKGSARWLGVGPFRIQPSEFGKIAVIAGMATYMSRFGRQGHLFFKGFLVPLSGLGVFALLLLLEPDYGATFILCAIGGLVMFAGGTRVMYLLMLVIGGVGGLVIMVFQNPNRLGRVKAFLYPELYPDQAYHLTQSLYAFYLGGMSGVGLGNSMQKRFYLPEAHTDFIFAIIAEELGFFASIGVLLLFLLYFLCGMIISFRARDSFGRLLGFGVTMMIGIQAAVNIAVVTGLGPTKGLALPFISYGGSNLVSSLLMTGILLSIARDTYTEEDQGKRRHAKDRAHRV